MFSRVSLPQTVDSIGRKLPVPAHLPGMESTLDLGAKVTAELAYLHAIFLKADEFYRLYREALLNLESNRDKPRSAEWIPLSDQ